MRSITLKHPATESMAAGRTNVATSGWDPAFVSQANERFDVPPSAVQSVHARFTPGAASDDGAGRGAKASTAKTRRKRMNASLWRPRGRDQRLCHAGWPLSPFYRWSAFTRPHDSLRTGTTKQSAPIPCQVTILLTDEGLFVMNRSFRLPAVSNRI